MSFCLVTQFESSGACRSACPAGGNEVAGSSRALNLHRPNGPVKRMFGKMRFLKK